MEPRTKIHQEVVAKLSKNPAGGINFNITKLTVRRRIKRYEIIHDIVWVRKSMYFIDSAVAFLVCCFSLKKKLISSQVK